MGGPLASMAALAYSPAMMRRFNTTGLCFTPSA